MLVESWGIEIEPADRLRLGLEIGVMTVQPVDTLVGFEVGPVENAPNGSETDGPVMSFIDDAGRQIRETPARGRAVMFFGLAGSQVDDGKTLVRGKKSGVARSEVRPAGLKCLAR